MLTMSILRHSFQRRLCPFPQRGEYTGHGDPSDASNFKCVEHDNDFDPRNLGAQIAYDGKFEDEAIGNTRGDR
jgi:hypothetical protein